MFLLVLVFIKCLWELIGLLSNYHNKNDLYMYYTVSAMFLSDFELAPNIVITLPFYLNNCVISTTGEGCFHTFLTSSNTLWMYIL